LGERFSSVYACFEYANDFKCANHVQSAVTVVALRELEGKITRVEHVQVSDGKRLSACEGGVGQLRQEVQAAKTDLERCIQTVVSLASSVNPKP
jgi:hypothetical protein